MASKLGVPVSQRRGPRSAAGRTLATGSSSSSAGSAPQHAGVRAVPLVRAGHEDVAADGVDVDRAVRREVHGVDEDAGAGVVGGGDDRCEVGDRAEQVGGAGDRDPAGALVDQVGHRGRVEPAGLPGRTGRGRARRRPGRTARRHGVTLASWSSRVPTTRSPGRSVAATARVNASVSVVMLAPKATPPADAPSSSATRARARSRRASQASAAANAPPELALSPLAAHVRHRLDRPVDHLRARRPVEAGPPVADTWEPLPQGLRIHRRRVCHLG